MIDPKEAYIEVMNLVSEGAKKKRKRVPIEMALGKNLGEDLVSQKNIPPFERSPYDGYAFRSWETRGAKDDASLKFEITATLPAGSTAKKVETGKKAVKIMTGAPLPDEYDCVIPFEAVDVVGNNVFLYRTLDSGENVIPCGEDVKAGEFLLPAGKNLTSRDIGVLASLGYEEIEVVDPPKVGIVVSGSELVELDKSPGRGEIRNSNRYILSASLKELKLEEIKYYGIVEDSKTRLKEVILKALNEVDILITTGGVSVGEYDLVPEALDEIGAERIFWKINARPGTPLHVAKYNDVPIFSLSGNPAALYASYKVFVEKAILKICGLIEGKSILETAVKGFLEEEITKKTIGQWRFIRAKGYIHNGKLWCKETKKEKPGIISSLVISNGFILLSPENQPLSREALVYFMPFDFNQNWDLFYNF